MLYLLVLAVVAAPPPAKTAWEVSSRQDPFSDKWEAVAALRGDRGILIVSCKEADGGPSLDVLFPLPMGTENYKPVAVRFDDSSPTVQTWLHSGASVHLPAMGSTTRMVQRLQSAKRLAVRATDMLGVERDAVFDLAGSNSAIREMAEECWLSEARF